MPDVIGLDIGHSAVKVAAAESFLFPTAAIPAVDLSVAAADVAAKSDTVWVGSRRFFVGDTAVIQSGGRVLNGLSDDWIDSDEHHALLLAGYQKAMRQMGASQASIALGLPSRLYAAQKERLRTRASTLLGIPQDAIAIVPQPMAAFYNSLLTADGVPSNQGADESKWFIIDIGYYTTDFGCIDHGVWSAAGQESMAGTHVAAQHIRRLIADRYGLDLSTRDAEQVLRTKTIRDQGEVIGVTAIVEQATGAVAKAIIDGAIQVFGAGAIRGAAGIYVAGGGSALIFDAVKRTWRHAMCAANPRFAVAEGLRRCALAYALVEA